MWGYTWRYRLLEWDDTGQMFINHKGPTDFCVYTQYERVLSTSAYRNSGSKHCYDRGKETKRDEANGLLDGRESKWIALIRELTIVRLEIKFDAR